MPAQEHIDRQDLLRFTPACQNLSRAIHATAVVAGSSFTGIQRASGASPYDKDRLRPLGWLRLQVPVWPASARSGCGANSSSFLRPKVQRLAPAYEHRRKSSTMTHCVRENHPPQSANQDVEKCCKLISPLQGNSTRICVQHNNPPPGKFSGGKISQKAMGGFIVQHNLGGLIISIRGLL